MGKVHRHNRKGRSEGGHRFMQLDYRLLETPAALALSGTAFKVLIYLFKRHDGFNNGKIAFGARSGCFKRKPGGEGQEPELIEVSIALKPSTISDALFELERAGFIRCTKESTFDQKRLVREWRFTWLPCDGLAPTREFEGAQGSFKRPKRRKPVRQGAQLGELQCALAQDPPAQEPQSEDCRPPRRHAGESDSAPSRPHLLAISSASGGPRCD